MKQSLKILFVTAECDPYAKTGGLGDVTGSLPVFLKSLGHTPVIIMPFYRFIDSSKYKLSISYTGLKVNMGNETIVYNIYMGRLGEHVPVYFIDYPPFFDRPNIYHDDLYHDYSDNPKRFSFLAMAALRFCIKTGFAPDIVHAHDWHTAILPAYIKTVFADDPLLNRAASLLTIHNLAYQGIYDRGFFPFTGLPDEEFTPDKFEAYNAINFLKGGICFADKVNTVSKGYAAETVTPEGGFGLDRFLVRKGEHYTGILNGADYSVWDPEIDNLIPANYSPDDLSGKSICKRILQERMNLETRHDTPLIGIVSRFTEQKGLFLVAECIGSILDNLDVELVVLGSGEKSLEGFFSGLPGRFPGRAAVHIGYNNELAHLIEAGSDLFLMPSVYEPCGLNQIYSMKYGTLPVVRATGGLDETVANYDELTGNGTGFKFREQSCGAVYHTVEWAIETYRDRKSHFSKLIRTAMEMDYSWQKSAAEYVTLYIKAINRKTIISHVQSG